MTGHSFMAVVFLHDTKYFLYLTNS